MKRWKIDFPIKIKQIQTNGGCRADRPTPPLFFGGWRENRLFILSFNILNKNLINHYCFVFYKIFVLKVVRNFLKLFLNCFLVENFRWTFSRAEGWLALPQPEGRLRCPNQRVPCVAPTKGWSPVAEWNGNCWELLEIAGNWWKLLEIARNWWKLLEINENCKKFQKIIENWWKLLKIYEN